MEERIQCFHTSVCGSFQNGDGDRQLSLSSGLNPTQHNTRVYAALADAMELAVTQMLRIFELRHRDNGDCYILQQEAAQKVDHKRFCGMVSDGRPHRISHMLGTSQQTSANHTHNKALTSRLT